MITGSLSYFMECRICSPAKAVWWMPALSTSLKVSCLEACYEHLFEAVLRWNTEGDRTGLEEEVEEDSGRLSLLPLGFSLSFSLYRPDLTPQDEHKKQWRSSKGDCHHISVVCGHYLQGLPAALKQEKNTDLSNQKPISITLYTKRNRAVLCIVLQS